MGRGGFARPNRGKFQRRSTVQEGRRELAVSTDAFGPKVVSTRTNGWPSSEEKPTRHEHRFAWGRCVDSDSSSTQFVDSEGSQIDGDSEALEVASPTGFGPSRLPSWSEGAGEHNLRACMPCAWYWKPAGCMKSQDCGYCHLCPAGELKRRKKAKIMMLRSGITSLVQEQPKEVNDVDNDEAASSKYVVMVKNTFIHVEFDNTTSPADLVTAAGLTFVSVKDRGNQH